MKPILFLLMASAGAFLTASRPCLADTPPRYRLTVLPLTFSGYTLIDQSNEQCGGINARGQIVGTLIVTLKNPYDTRAALWFRGHLRILDPTPIKSIPAPDDSENQDFTYAAAVNAQGETIGSATNTFSGAYSGGGSAAWMWSGGKLTGLKGFPTGSDTDSAALGINARGEIVGGYTRHYDSNVESSSEPPTPPSEFASHAFLWYHGHIRTLWNGVARGINNQSEIVGTQASGGYERSRDKGVLWRKGQITLLKMQPVAINERGEVAGNIPLTEDIGKACVWRRGRTIRLSKQTSHAYALNNRGEVVGETNSPAFSHTFRAALWRRGRTYDLNRCVSLPPGWTLNSAIGINDRGRIIGMGSASKTTSGKQSTRTFTFLLTPQ